jgi:hypothetical protein
MAGVAIGISLEIILMLGFGLPEVACPNDFRNDLARPQACSIDVGDGVFGNPLLLVTGVEDRRSVARPDVVALAIARGRVSRKKTSRTRRSAFSSSPTAFQLTRHLTINEPSAAAALAQR